MSPVCYCDNFVGSVHFCDLGHGGMIKLLMFTGRESGIRVDRVAVRPSWRTVPGSTFRWTTISVSHGSHTIHHTDPGIFLAVWCYGHAGNTQEAYGYQAGYYGESHLNQALTASFVLNS